jgi:diguanylate cyclase (GGDEF)-like protein
MKMTLRARFATICTVLVAVSIIAASVIWFLGVRALTDNARQITIESIRSHAQADLELRARTIAGMLAENLANPVYFYDLYQIRALLLTLMDEQDISYIIVFDPDGKVIHDGQPDIPSFGQIMGDPMAENAINAEEIIVQWSDLVLDVAVPIELGEVRVGGVRLGVSQARVKQEILVATEALSKAYDAEVSQRINNLLFLLALLLLVAAVAAVMIAKNLVRPIKRLVSYTSRIEEGEYQAEADTGRSDEIGDLMRAFDRMSESVRRNTLEIRHIAYHDSLSGLPNRLMFREFLEHRLSGDLDVEKSIALLFLDLDDFKRVNDTLGHDHGDQLLVAFAERLRVCVMDPSIETDDSTHGASRLVARLGGDEFTVMLIGENSRESARQLARLILDAVTRPFRIQEREFFVSTSIGITIYPDDAQSADLLVKNADIAMYGAKLAGKNRYQFFHEKMVADADQRMELENHLRKAVRNHEFEVHYQPILELPDLNIVGAEALLRWHHPERGRLPPAIFIPLAEDLGLIELIGQQVLEIACRDLAGWPSTHDGQPLYVSVNLSGRQVRTDRIVKTVKRTIEKSSITASQLALELTENSLLESEEQASSVLQELRDLGIQVWLDDFGTGFSGLNHLRRLPVDGVKIDRTFVSDIQLDPDDLALTSGIIAMALSLNMKVTAEGVESEGQMQTLVEHGCQLAQGYLFGKAMPNQDFLEFLDTDRSVATKSA